MEIYPDKCEEFEATWLRVGQSVTSHPANLGQELLRDLEDPALYYITSDWTSEPEFREFEKSDAHLRHRQQLHPFRQAGSMRVMRPVFSLPPGRPDRTAH